MLLNTGLLGMLSFQHVINVKIINEVVCICFSFCFWTLVCILYSCMNACSVTSVGSDSLRPYGLQPARLLCLCDSPGKNTGVSCPVLLPGIFPTRGSNLRLLHWQVDSLPLSHQRNPKIAH